MNRITATELNRQLLNQLKESLLDLDIIVDDFRREREEIERRLVEAMRYRDRIEVELRAAIAGLEEAAA